MKMNKRLFYNILMYICLFAMLAVSIFQIIMLAQDLHNLGYEARFVTGIVIFSIVIILVIGVFIKMIKEELYRQKFKK